MERKREREREIEDKERRVDWSFNIKKHCGKFIIEYIWDLKGVVGNRRAKINSKALKVIKWKEAQNEEGKRK